MIKIKTASLNSCLLVPSPDVAFKKIKKMFLTFECNLSLSPADYVLVKDARTEIKHYSKQCFIQIWI